METKFEEKFIVINKKHLEELKKHGKENPNAAVASIRVSDLLYALESFHTIYRKFIGKELDQKYYVCNQDEAYAQKVIDTIIEGETVKENQRLFKDIDGKMTPTYKRC